MSEARAWTAPYKEFERIFSRALDNPHIISHPGAEAIIDRDINSLYAQHKGDPAWDEAHFRWQGNDVINNAKLLLSLHPAPWKFDCSSLSGYVVDANEHAIFGGERHEGYVGPEDPGVAALVDVINALGVYIGGNQ